MHTRANAISTTSQWYYKWSDKMRSSLPLLRAFWRIPIYAVDVTYTIQWHSCIVHRKKNTTYAYIYWCVYRRLAEKRTCTATRLQSTLHVASECIPVKVTRSKTRDYVTELKKNSRFDYNSKKSGNLYYYLLTN